MLELAHARRLQRANLYRAEQRNVLESSKSFAFEYRFRNN